MHPVSLEDYWELLENHNWFYAFARADERYDQLVIDTHVLHGIGQQSYEHLQLYTTYMDVMYRNMIFEDDRVLNKFQPNANKPEAA